MSAALATVPDPYDRPSVLRLFESLAAMRVAMTAGGSRSASALDDEAFEQLTDHLVIATPSPNFGRSRFEFCGSTVAEMGRAGDVSGLSFGDMMIDDLARQALSGYKRVGELGVAHVSVNRPVISPRARMFTRLLMPLFIRDRLALTVGAVVFHNDPLDLGDVMGQVGRRV